MKKPYICPVCEGKGIVSSDFYDDKKENGIPYQSCRTCSGSGVIWKEETKITHNKTILNT